MFRNPTDAQHRDETRIPGQRRWRRGARRAFFKQQETCTFVAQLLVGTERTAGGLNAVPLLGNTTATIIDVIVDTTV